MNQVQIFPTTFSYIFSIALTEKALEPRKWQWAFPMIEGVPPCPRGGHSAVLSGASIVIFGV